MMERVPVAALVEEMTAETSVIPGGPATITIRFVVATLPLGSVTVKESG